MPLVQTRGAASAQGFGEFAQAATAVNYIEEVFSTFLYTGDATVRSIDNGIDLSTKGGLVWIKNRTFAGAEHQLFDTARGATKRIKSDLTDAEVTTAGTLTSFDTTGFSLGTQSSVNFNTYPHVSWTFRKQPKFFDVLTYTGTGSNTTIAHSLGSVPGSIIVKRTDTTANWAVYHRSLANTQYLVLNTTAAAATGATWWNSTTPTSAVFSIGTDASVNASGGTYVAYVFAHDAGGFGLTGTDNVISCGSFTTVSSGYSPNVELGYEPQWIMLKRTDSTGNWLIVDTMRGWVDPSGTGANDANLRPNLSDAENTNDIGWPYATGFNAGYRGGAESTWIYIAIRRGPMKVPTSGTEVFLPKTRTGNGTAGTVVAGASWPMDMLWISRRTGGGAGVGGFTDIDRLRGAYLGGNNPLLRQTQTDAELTSYVAPGFVGGQTSYDLPSGGGYGLFNTSAVTYVDYLFRRSPTVFDEVCYTGTGVARTVAHNLGVVPEMMIVKCRSHGGSSVYYWAVYVAPLGNTANLDLSSDVAVDYFNEVWNNTSPTSSVFTVGPYNRSGALDKTYVAYLFATCAGVSKVGTYTGNGTTQTINCGFGAGGARFVLIKRSDAVGDWYTYDTARGMTTLTDPYLLMNLTTAESATLGSVTTVSTGFAVDESILAGVNTNAAIYIFLAIA